MGSEKKLNEVWNLGRTRTQTTISLSPSPHSLRGYKLSINDEQKIRTNSPSTFSSCVQTPFCKKMQLAQIIQSFPTICSNCFFKEKLKGCTYVQWILLCNYVQQKSISHLMFKLPLQRLLLQLSFHQGWDFSPVLVDLEKSESGKQSFFWEQISKDF